MAEGSGAERDPTPPESGDRDPARSAGVLPAEAVESWRTWLMTGHSGVVSDPRRLRGSHRGLKQILVHGTGRDLPQSWRHFSGAMVRLAINDALNLLPKDQTHVVWLAYFGGLSNSQIAARLGLSVGGVERRLKQAFDFVSDYVEHGRNTGRKAVLVILGWLSLGRLVDAWRQVPQAVNHAVMTSAIVVAGTSAAVIVGATAQPVANPGIQAPAIVHAAAPAGWTSTVTSAGHSSDAQPLSQSIDTATRRAKTITVPAAGTNVTVPPLPSLPPIPPLPTPPVP